jgi:hypothetical protein
LTTPRPSAAQALPIFAALALVLGAGLVHGRWTRRWSGSPELAAAVAGLRRFPEAVGGRPGRSFALTDEELAMAEIDSYVARIYEDPRGGPPVTVLLACGRPGPISVHTPDVCFVGGGYAPVREPVRCDLPVGPSGRVAGVRRAVFRKTNSVVPTYRHVLWSWTTSGTWEAPDNPRLTFASRPVLYKLYVVREADTAGGRVEDDPNLKFLQALLPALGRTLFEAR